ncbi:tetratricopeptide repeat protein [Akkermansia muciniphila]|uniref:tetratricopeptide repeat protein n=1 Tax=Akkermansia muciniphila TaxID=239935 RepID=UPI000C9A5148|nr:tetratricopeptide repeat protein [Akkermansia muciniphila]PNC05066.1 hypothetical protein CXU21_07910 [Akkermansia muciniphila]
MKAFLFVNAGLMALAAFAAAQENIPDAAPVPDGPLVANPEQDTLDMADMLYKQAQEPAMKGNPQEHGRLLDLSLRKYLEFSQRFPQSAQAPLAEYRAAMCLTELGRKADAHALFRRLTQTGTPALIAASAYRLATAASAAGEAEKAIQYYQLVVRNAEQNDLKVDAQYRLGRLFLSSGNPEGAATMFCAVMGNPQADGKFVLVSRMGYAALCADTGRLGEAYSEYRKVLETPGVDDRNRGIATLQAAMLATKLKKTAEAQVLYERLLKDESLKEMAPEARMGLLLGLYNMGKYKEILSQYAQQKDMKMPTKEGEVRLLMLLGQSAYKLKEYQKAADFFLEAEKTVPYTQEAMQASFYRLLCYNELKQKDLPQRAQSFLNHYAKAFPTSELHDLVRLMAAENLFNSSPADAARFYASIDFDKLPPKMRADILYKSAWAIAQAGNREVAATLLTDFINKYPQDPRICEALTLRGDMYAKTKKEAEALMDFDRVIARWPKEESAAAAWQRAAQIYAGRQDMVNMAKYYEGLIQNFPKASPAALAEAHFLLGRAAFDQGDFKSSISHMAEAKTLDPQKYGEQVNVLSVLSYHKLQDVKKLKEALETLQKENPSAVARVPDVIPAWLGLQAYGMKDLETADKYMTWATQNDQLQNVKKVIWRNLAKVRLALKKYDRALVASNNFLKDEDQPYRRADGLLDKASILLGLGRYADARKTAEEALALGVEGPLMASLKIILGDISYAEKKFDEAAKYYGVTAELFVNDAELKPKALFKAAEALDKAGRKSEASQYRARLQKEFPDWKQDEESLPPDAR